MAKIITVWGSPGSGKSMFCCMLAKALTRDKRKAIIVNADNSVPMLPVFKGLPGKKFAEFSITDILKNQYHVLPKHTIHNIQPVLLSKEVADILETTENFPVLLFESVTWGILNDMVFPIKCYYKTDKSQFSYMQYHTVV